MALDVALSNGGIFVDVIRISYCRLPCLWCL